jgi:hypothetical protein
MNLVRRSILVGSASVIALLAGQSVAGAETAPVASPGAGIPVFGGLVDSVVGIVTGTVYGIGGAASAVLASLTGGVL